MTTRRRFEVEVKLRVASLPRLRRCLKRLGARRLARVHEDDTLYDTRSNSLKRHGQLLRLRLRGARRALLTYKGRETPNPRYKVRREIELAVSEPKEFRAILEAVGFRPWFRYEKYRTSYRLPRLPDLAVELDETPIGTFLELEGPPGTIDRAAQLLGYRPGDYLATTYYALYLRARRRLRLPAPTRRFSGALTSGPRAAMLFPKRKARAR